MDTLIFRNDDVSSNTNLLQLQSLYKVIEDAFPLALIISGVTLFSKYSRTGSVYPGYPFKDKNVNWFYNVDRCLRNPGAVAGKVASHGMFHIDHSKVSCETQEMSIIGSCRYLETDVFIPPFNRYNASTLAICKDNEIDCLTPDQGWRSLDFNEFNPDHKLWYFHSWKFTARELREKLVGNSVNVG